MSDPNAIYRTILNICADGADAVRPGAGDPLRKEAEAKYPNIIVEGVDTWTCGNCRAINPSFQGECGLCRRLK